MHFADTLYGEIKNGVIVLDGYISNVTVEREMLLRRDGLKGSVVEKSFGRAHCPVSRIISTQNSGYISFDAIRWLQGIGASFAHLNYDGTPLLVSAPYHTVSASLRRTHVLTPVERANRSMRVTVTTSPGPRALSIVRSSRRSARAPVTFLRWIFRLVHPAARSCSSWASRVCP